MAVYSASPSVLGFFRRIILADRHRLAAAALDCCFLLYLRARESSTTFTSYVLTTEHSFFAAFNSWHTKAELFFSSITITRIVVIDDDNNCKIWYNYDALLSTSVSESFIVSVINGMWKTIIIQSLLKLLFCKYKACDFSHGCITYYIVMYVSSYLFILLCLV